MKGSPLVSWNKRLPAVNTFFVLIFFLATFQKRGERGGRDSGFGVIRFVSVFCIPVSTPVFQFSLPYTCISRFTVSINVETFAIGAIFGLRNGRDSQNLSPEVGIKYVMSWATCYRSKRHLPWAFQGLLAKIWSWSYRKGSPLEKPLQLFLVIPQIAPRFFSFSNSCFFPNKHGAFVKKNLFPIFARPARSLRIFSEASSGFTQSSLSTSFRPSFLFLVVSLFVSRWWVYFFSNLQRSQPSWDN